MHKPIRFGLDISDHSVELIGLSERDGKVIIEWAGRLKLPAGIVQRGVILDQERLVQVLSQLFDGAFGKGRDSLQVALALPETQVYSKVFSLPYNLTSDLALKAAVIEAADVLPIRLNEAITAAAELSATEDHREYFLVAVNKDIIQSYLEVFRLLDVELLFLESEAVAMVRSLVRSGVDPVMIVDIGAAVTGMVIHDQGGVRLASVANIGGNALTSALEIKMNIPLEKAERFKRNNGFLPTKDRGRVFLVLQQPMAEIINEVQETISYYSKKTGRKITKILLVGGNSLLPGIVDYVASNFPDASIELGQPFQGIALTTQQKAVGEQSILFSTAVGVAWRAAGFRRGWGFDFLLTNNRQSFGIKNLLGLARKVGLVFNHMVQKKTKSAGKAKSKKATKAKAKAKSIKPKKKAVAKKSAKKAAKKTIKKSEIEEAVSELELGMTPEPELDLGVGAEAEEPKMPSEEVSEDVFAESPKEEAQSDSIYRLGSSVNENGQGVGDVLQGLEEDDEEYTKDSSVDVQGEEEELEMSDEDMGMTESDTEKITVDTILARAKQDEDEDMGAYRQAPKGRGRLVALVILIIVLAVATAGGVYMLMRTHGADLISGISFGKKDVQTELPMQETSKEKPAVPETISLSVLLGTTAQPEGAKPFMLTRAIETELATSGVFDSTGQATTTAGRSEGVIKIVNTTEQTYTFVATTRFLAEDGVLFRLKEATPIPAEGSVDASVAADKPGADYDIGPAKFTIPGLGSEYEDRIWGESEASMSGGAGLAKAVTSADLVKAKADLLENLEKEATDKLKELAQPDEAILPDLMTSEEIAFEAPEAEVISANFKAELKTRFRAMVLPQAEVEKKLVIQLLAVLPEGENQADYDIGLPQYTVEAYDTKAGLAEVRIEATISKSFAAPADEIIE